MSSLKSNVPTLNSIQGISIIGLPDEINNTLQYDAITNTLKWVAASSGSDKSMNEFEYLARVARGDLPSGILVNIVNTSITTAVIGTVPVGKDWYLISWSYVVDNFFTNSTLKFPTETSIEIVRSDTQTALIYIGISKGNKITENQTITILRSAAVGNSLNMTILQVNKDASITIP